MKTLLTIFTLVFTLMFSSIRFAEWTKVGSAGRGERTFFVDFERTRKHNGYVYWWDLANMSKPQQGVLSSTQYKQGECAVFRYKILSITVFKEPMAVGTLKTFNLNNNEWRYPLPNGINETILKSVCNR